mgnify:FL=1
MANVAYVRVSARDQNESRQVEALEKYEIDKWFSEKASAKNIFGRGKFMEMLDWVRDGDTVYVMDFSRLARSTKDLLNIIEQFQTKGVSLVSTKESFDTSTSVGKLMLTMMAAINEFERQNLLERQAEGIAIAKRKGKYKGRAKIVVSNIARYYDQYMHREKSKTKIAEELNISRNTLNRLFGELVENRA